MDLSAAPGLCQQSHDACPWFTPSLQDKLPFVTMGSGSLAAMAMMETGYKDGLSEAEAKALVASAIRAGIFNDLGSGAPP